MKNQIQASQADVIIQENDLIQNILSNRKTKAVKEVEQTELPEVFTSKEFFTDNNPFGLMKMETFKMLVSVMSESELYELGIVLEKLNANEYFEYSSVPYGNGAVKKLYAYISGPRGKEKFTFPAVDDVSKFLARYIMRRFTCKFSLKELYNSVQEEFKNHRDVNRASPYNPTS